MKALYDILTLVLALGLYPVFYFHSRGKRRLAERYGFWASYPECQVVWFHGASVGEVQGLMPLMKEYKVRFPETYLLLTAMSPTGLDVAESVADEVHLLPYDHMLFLRELLGRLDVKVFLFGETELWPTLLTALAERNVPLHLVNGVLSDKSFPWYRRLKGIFTTALKRVESISVSDQKSYERFVAIGADREKVQVTGNAKYDRPPSITSQEEAMELRRSFFKDITAPVVTLGSIHPGELDFWMPALKLIQEENSQLLIVIAPRHREKFQYFEDMLQKNDLSYFKRSQHRELGPGSAPICLLDTFGELESVYSFSNAAFVGGTFVEIGGHNPFEPASYGVLPVIGPHDFKISSLVQELKSEGAVQCVNDVNEVNEIVNMVLQEPQKVAEQGADARKVWQKHQGATERILLHMESA